MSRTHKTISTSAFERKHDIEHWWDHPLAIAHWCMYGQPTNGLYAPPPRRGQSKAKAAYRKKYWGGERNRVRMALLKQEEPEPSRTRHSVLWDLS